MTYCRKRFERAPKANPDALCVRDVCPPPCVIGQYCERHGFIHGMEAEQLRQGIERLIERGEDDVLEELQQLLDHVDARDALAFMEAHDEPDSDAQGKIVVVDTRPPYADDVVFWRPDSAGYTWNLDEAGIYEPSDLDGMRSTDIGVPLAVVEPLAVRHVPVSALRERFEMSPRKEGLDLGSRQRAKRLTCDLCGAPIARNQPWGPDDSPLLGMLCENGHEIAAENRRAGGDS